MTDPLLNVTYTNYTATTFNNTFSFGSSIKNTTVTIDGYGRRINVQTQQAPSSSNYDTSSTSYGWSGNYKTVNTATPCTTTLGSACVTSHTNYHDPLGRLYQAATVSNETVTKTYPQNDVVTTLSPAPAGENNKSTQKEYDGLGRVVKLCQILSSGGSACNQNTGTSSGTLTSYTYSAFAGGTQVQATRGSQTRTKNYDAFGRMTSETNPESGTTTYVYDSDPAVCKTPAFNGDLVRKTDANGNNTCYFYDRLHRLAASGTYNNNVWVAGSCRRFNYDTAANGFFTPTNYQGSNLSGRLVEAETDNCTPYPPTAPITDEWFSYDADGRLTDFYEKTPHSGGWYHTTASYFANGALNTLGGIPGYTTETYGLDGEGRLNTATEGSTAEVSSVTFNAASQPLTIAIGAANKDSDTYTYDPNTGRMSTYTFTVGTTPASMVGRLTWNPNGTLRTLVITDGFNTGGTQTCNFGTSTVAGYDDLGRIVDDDCGSVWAQTFSYDQYNNLTKAGGLTWNPGYNSKNQYSNIGATYDAAGNITYDVTWHHYQWDGYNKVVGIGNPAVCGTSGTCLTYDALGRMVERVVNSTYNEVLYSPVGKTASMSGLTTVNYSYLPLPGGGRLYSTGSTGSNRNYQHKDWLGSVRLESVISSSTISLDRAYAPYGEVYANFGSAGHYNFTGDTQEVVADGATFDTDNRELNSGQGRWLSPDPAGAGWNLYAYPTNPNNGIDPSGLVDINPGWYLGYGAFNSTMSSMNAYAAGFDNWINSTFFNSVPANSTTSTSSGSATSNSGTSTGSSNGVDRILNGISAFAATFGQSAAAAMFQVEGAPGEEAPPESENLDPINPLEPIDPETSRGPWAFNLMNPGPLDEGHAQDFAGGQYSPITVGEGGSSSDTALYRAYGGASGETGKDGTYYMLVPQVGGLQSAIDGAINPNWGAAGMGRPYSNPYSNGISLANTVCVYLPPGTQAYIGPIAYQGGAWVGGGLQVYVPPNQ